MNQLELVEWLKPSKYIEGIHYIIRNRYKKYCVKCERLVTRGEYAVLNIEKKTIFHINCKEEHVLKRPKNIRKQKTRVFRG
jgi:hypothetical protein